MTAFEWSVKAHAGNGVAVGRESEEEEVNTITTLEVPTSKGSLESVTSKHRLGAVEINLPEIGSLKRMVSFKSNAGGFVDETRAVSIPATDDVCH
jgi:hypothetical protein